MMNQYKQETSQIHAPAELIRKTKEAMREEEQRLNREGKQKNVIVQPKHSYGKVYKWALPVAAAAAFCVMLFSVSIMRFGSGSGSSKSNSSMDMASGAAGPNDMGLQFGTADIAEEMEAAAEEPIDKSGSKYDMAAGAATESATDNGYAGGGYDGAQYADATATSENNEDAAYENSYIDSLYGNSAMMTNDVQKSDQDGASSRKADSYAWKIREVSEIPSADDHTVLEEHISVQGIDFLVVYNMDDIWCAYATGDDGKLYLIFTEAAVDEFSVEEFADMAYERLMETVSSAE